MQRAWRDIYSPGSIPSSTETPDTDTGAATNSLITEKPQDVFRVMTFNILAQAYISLSMYKAYPTCDHIIYKYREDLIVSHIGEVRPDIIGLQEVGVTEYHSLSRRLGTLGYCSVHLPMPYQSPSKGKGGLCLLWNGGTQTFPSSNNPTDPKNGGQSRNIVLEHYQFYPLITPATHTLTNLIGSSNLVVEPELRILCLAYMQLAIFRFTYSKSANKTLIVANTHLHYDPSKPYIKTIQMSIACSILDRVTQWPGLEKAAVVFMGDFNSIPLKYASDEFDTVPEGTAPFMSGVYELATLGSIDASHSHLAMPLSAPNTAPPVTLTHKQNLRSAYVEVTGSEPYCTNHTQKFRNVIDYIFYGNNNKIGPVRVLMPPTSAYLDKYVTLPNADWPSDHIDLVCDFVFK